MTSCQYTDQAEDKRIRQQLARNGNRDVAARRLQPLTGCTELYFASYGIYRDKQYQHLKEYKKERLAQVDRVIQRRVINGMIVGLHGEQKGFYLLFVHSQRHSFHHDGERATGASELSKAAINSPPTESRA